MASILTPCPSCSRHVKVGPPVCPFCGGDVPTSVAPRTVTLAAGKPLTRAAIMFAGAAAIGACSSSSSEPLTASLDAAYGFAVGPHDAGTDVEFVVHYGVVSMPDAASDAERVPPADAATDAAVDAPHGSFDAAYGVFIDSGS